MRANVLNDAALVKQARQFVWLSMDYDKPANGALMEKFAAGGVPLFLIIDPATEKAALAWYGSATAPQLVTLLSDGTAAITGGLTGAESWLARADQLNGQKQYTEAVKLYEQALQSGGASWSRRSRTIESLVTAQTFGRNEAACVETAAREAPSMPRDRSFVNVVYMGLDCTESGAKQVEDLTKLAEEGVKIPGVLGDDTSALHQILAAIYRREKREADATRVATAWVDYLKQQIAKAPNAEGRIGYDLHLSSAATFLHKPELALGEVERAERDLPNDYNPPRLAAGLYRQLGRDDDALAAYDRALPKAYGSIRLTLYIAKGQVLEKKGDAKSARATYTEGIAYGKSLPEATAKGGMTQLEKAMAKLP